MKLRAFWMLGLALILAGTSVYLAKNWIQGQVKPTIVQKVEAPPIEMATVVIAATPLFRGDRVRREHLRLVDWPADAVPPSAFSTIEEIIGDRRAGAGAQAAADGARNSNSLPRSRVALRSIEINEPVLKNKISGFGERASVSTMLSPEMRAATIRMNDVSGVAGFVLPGDHVDILLTRAAGGAQKGGVIGANLITDILLQNIRVLGIDQDANEQRDKPAVVKAVTVEVTPVQAQKLTLAQRLGELSLALRHVANVAAEVPRTVSLRDLRVGEANLELGQKPAAVKKTVAVKKTTPKTKTMGLRVRIVRGTTASSVEVQADKRPLFASPPEPRPAAAQPPGQLADTAAPKLTAPGAASFGGASSAAVDSSPFAKPVSAPLSLLEPFDDKASTLDQANQ